MTSLRFLAWLATKWLYLKPVVSDTASNGPLFFVTYVSWTKLRNYWRVRQAERMQKLLVPGFPTELRIDPTSICNLRCPLCPTGLRKVDRGAGYLTLEAFEKVLDRFARYLFCVRLWAWGDPMLNKDLSRIVAMAHQRRVGTEICTNLSIKLSDQKIDDLIKSGLTWLTVSMDAATAETYGQYRIGGSFELVTSNMRRFVERKNYLGSLTPFVEWQWVPFRHNEAEMHQASDLALKLGVDGLRFKLPRIDKTQHRPYEEGIPRDLLAWLPRDPILSSLVLDERGYLIERHCPHLWRSVTIHFDGGIAPCCETFKTQDDFGHLDSDFQSLWNGEIYREARRIALGIDLTPADERIACYHCKVFNKPQSRRASLASCRALAEGNGRDGNDAIA